MNLLAAMRSRRSGRALPPSCFIKKERWLSKKHPKGTYVQLLTKLINGNLTGIENDNQDGEADSPFASQPCQNKDLAKLNRSPAYTIL